MASNPTDTMGEALKKLLGQIAQMSTMPDADLEFITTLQQTVVDKIRQGNAPAPPTNTGQPDPNAAPGGMPGGMPGAPPGMGAPPPPPSPMGGPAMGLSPSAPNMDEMKRMLGSSQVAQ